MNETSVPTPLGSDLHEIRSAFINALLTIGEGVTLATQALTLVAGNVSESTNSEWTFEFPLGLSPSGEVVKSSPAKWSKERLHRRLLLMRDLDLSVTALFQLVTLTDAWLQQILRRVLRQFPQKLGQKKMVPISAILAAKSIDAAHVAAMDGFIHDLSYRSPREQGEAASEILSIDILAIPAFERFIEIKATRDIWIHSLGRANDIYTQKARSHSRVAAGEYLPVTPTYLLQSYETCIQLIEGTHNALEQLWPAPAEMAAPLFTPTEDSGLKANEPKSP
jgi:hypothetical protein